MSTRYPGGLITKTPVVPTLASAPGVWTLEQALAYIKAGTWPFPGALDPYFNQTTLLLHGDGNQGATNLYNSGSPAYLAFADNSNNNFSITVQGDSYGSVFSPYETTYSVYFDGDAHFLISAGSGSWADFGTGDFTISAWVWANNVTNLQGVCGSHTSGQNDTWQFRIWNGKLELFGAQVTTTSTATIPAGQWVFLSASRSGSTVYLGVNGAVSTHSISAGGLYTAQTNVSVGNLYSSPSNYWLTGYVSNLQIVKGSALYTSNFTPSTSPTSTSVTNQQLLVCYANRFIDSNTATTAKTISTLSGGPIISFYTPFTLAANDNGSGYFDGSGDRIQTTLTAQSPGTGDFTYQLWVYRGNANSACLFDTRNVNNNTTGFTCLINGSGQLALYTNGTILTGSGTVPVSAWSFVSVSRSGTTVTLSLNGVSQGTVTFSNNLTDTNLWLGMYVDSTGPFTGYISDFRYIRGATASATPPTSPASNTANTQLLTCQYSGSVNNTGFIDSGPYDFLLTKVGNATQGTFSPFSLSAGYWSNYFDGAGDTLTSSSVAHRLDAAAFTIEMWLYSSPTVNTYGILGRSSSIFPYPGYILEVSNNKIRFQTNDSTNGTSSLGDIAATTCPLNQWFHLAIVREGTGSNQAKMYFNGALVATNSMPQNLNDFNTLTIGSVVSAGTTFFGYMSNVRIVKGTAVYTSAFTPPTAPLTAITNTQLLTCQSNRFVDNSANNLTITRNGDTRVTAFSPFLPTAPYSISTNSGSLSLDGSGDYVRRGTAGDPAFNFGSGNFTIEMFVYQNVLKNNASFVGEVPGTTNNTIHFGSTSTGAIFVTLTSTSTQINAPAGTCRAGEWQHIALVRNSGVTTLYVDGTSRGTPFSSSANMGLGQSVGFVIGSGHGGGDLNGYISNVRILKGVAQYTTTFTPPTAPLTPIANTSLLLNFTNAGIFDQTGKNALETVGNAQVDTNIRKYGIGSMKFDGTGDWLVCNGQNDLYAFGTGDWTVEFWLYLNNVSGQKNLYDSVPPSTNGAYPTIYVLNATLYYYTSNANRITNSNSLLVNTWYHIAVARSGTSTRMFVDGAQVGTTYTDTNNYLNGGTNRPIIGGSAFGPGGALHNGYIDDLRITKGVARYTANFTPPTRAFPNQ